MTRYGGSYYGADPATGLTTFYGELVVNEFDSSPFEVTSLGYGVLSITWRRPGGVWDEQRLVRNSTGYPIDVRDGTVVLDEAFTSAGTSFLDDNLTQGRFFYYALFVFDKHDQIWRRTGFGGSLTTKAWGYTNRLYQRLPEVFKHSDYNSLDSELLTDEQSFLYKYLSVLGFALDHVRTETESLRTILDARGADARVLPLLAGQVGVDYEPEIGTRQMRQLIANAIHVYGLKGTLAGLRELASLVSGWPASVRIGYNLALDDLDAGPDRSNGRWGGAINATVGYRTNKVTDDHPAGEGTLVISYELQPGSPTPQVAVIDMNRSTSGRGIDRMQYAVPVVNNVAYLPSIYLSSEVAGLQASMRLQWLSSAGEPLLPDPLAGDPVTLTPTMQRLSVLATAPTNARFLEASVEITGAMSAGEIARGCGFMVQENGPLAPWQCAREILLYLQAELINYVGNTSGADRTAWGWTDGVSAQLDADGIPYLAFTPLNVNTGVVALEDAKLLNVGDPGPPAGSGQAPQESTYTAGRVTVAPGDYWTALAEVRCPTGTRNVQIGFLLYQGTSFVGIQYGPAALVNADGYTELSYTLHVGADFSYDNVELSILYPDATGDETYSFRHAALEKIRGEGAFFFDGGQPSETGDYLWESQAFRSPTHYYSHRLPRAVRLRELVADFIPNGACFALAFAQATIPDSPRAVAGSDLDPAGFVPPPASGATVHLQWAAEGPVGAQLTTNWNVQMLAVGRNVTVEWAQSMLEQADIRIVFGDLYFNEPVTNFTTFDWDIDVTVNADNNLLWADDALIGNQNQLLWNQQENVAVSDGIVTP